MGLRGRVVDTVEKGGEARARGRKRHSWSGKMELLDWKGTWVYEGRRWIDSSRHTSEGHLKVRGRDFMYEYGDTDDSSYVEYDDWRGQFCLCCTSIYLRIQVLVRLFNTPLSHASCNLVNYD